MPMPWEKDWGAAQTSAPIPVKKEDKGGILPWLKDWASEQLGNSPKTTQKRSTIDNQGAGNTNPLDSIFKSLLQAESGSRHVDENGKLITSSKGAQGITQLMPSTAKKPGFGIEPVKDQSEAEYLRVGKSYLSALHGKYGNWEQALAAYNAGPGNVDKAIGKANRYGGDWKDYLPVKEETIPYINKILGKRSALDTPKEKFYPGTSIEQGIKNVKSMAYDVASMAPISGEAVSAKETFDFIKSGKLFEAGMSALGVIPVIGGLKRFSFLEKLAKDSPSSLLSKIEPLQRYVGDSENAQIYELVHGSKSKEKFTHVNARISKDGALGPGFYLTSDEAAAKSYGDNVRPVTIAYKKPLEITYTGSDDVVEQIAKNEDFWKTNFNTKGQAMKWARQQKEDFAGIGDEDFLEMLKEAGFDGVVMKDKSGKIIEATAVNRNQFRFLDD